LQNIAVATATVPYREAIQAGATAFFGDKYGDVVRTVTVGDYSCELCGGAHVSRTGDIGMIKIVSEGSVAAGVRRVEAVTGRGAFAYVRGLEDGLRRLSDALRVSRDELPARVQRIQDENKKLAGELKKARSDIHAGRPDDAGPAVEKIGDVALAERFVADAGPDDLRELSDMLRSKIGSGIVMLATEKGGKTSILISVTKDLANKIHAGELLKGVVAPFGGTGGGRADMAQGGAPKTGIFDELKGKLREVVKSA
jgi:alanyl-tRNA synthetase